MPGLTYAIAWIATNQSAFQGALQVLQPAQENSFWRNDATIEHPDFAPPRQYVFNHNKINGHIVYLANAEDERNVTALADIMINRLKRNHLHIRMFLISSLASIEDYSFLTPPLTTDSCLLDSFPPLATSLIMPDAERNGKRLLEAAARHQDTQLGEHHRSVPLFLYNIRDPSLGTNICRSYDFFGLPSMMFMGLCHASDMSDEAQTNSSAVAGFHIKGVLEHLERLEAIAN
ncbi:hypothetical protein TGAMA5MH_07880 [Trichoderma gamsii]|uniref:Uncharacterized protein n=1 Tax=Trichoderma gamsii TaxID=398673 RepID=A0A2K0T3Z1_9HYPO|nr:hypothetical protein TGAMA5MH_07880 [Trichoderma gamsii]